jgi:transcriptional regulator with XRE-family HTH domain
MSKPAKQSSEKVLRGMFASAISRCRDESDVSQEKLAELTGLSTSYISLLERGKRNLTVLTAARIAEAFNLKLSDFVIRAEQGPAER